MTQQPKEITLPKELKVGSKVRENYGKNHSGNKLFHVRAIVDETRVVMRRWSKSKQDWHYVIENEIYFHVYKSRGNLEIDND